MVFRARKCLTSVLCIQNQFNLTVRQRLRDVMLSPFSGNILVNEINDNSNKTLMIRDASRGEITNKAQDHNNIKLKADDLQLKPKPPTVTIRQHFKDEVVSSLSGNIFVNTDGEEVKKDAHEKNNIILKAGVPKLFQAKNSDQNATTPMKQSHCGKETKIKLQECNVILSPPGSLNRFKSVDTANIKEHFKTNAVPPFSGKICVALQVRFQVKTEADNKGKECKIFQPTSSSNYLKICAPNASACSKPIPCKPKPK